jgi:hypothetical protein
MSKLTTKLQARGWSNSLTLSATDNPDRAQSQLHPVEVFQIMRSYYHAKIARVFGVQVLKIVPIREVPR